MASISGNLGKDMPQSQCCVFCGSQSREECFGKFFFDSSSGIAVHQYCLFFAAGLEQNGADTDGFDGFLLDDIIAEKNRAKRLSCSYCRKKGASSGCCLPKCKSKYHYNCGKEHGSLFQFYKSFNSYCQKHRPRQKDCSIIVSEECPICLSAVKDLDGLESLIPPCCKNSRFHRNCLQKQAIASGLYYFRCPVCNNMDSFQEEMKKMGIFIPEQDAIWEEGDAYADLLYLHSACDAARCKCKYGREHSADHGPWKICLCFMCGQHGTHLRCQGWSKEPSEWICAVCAGGFDVGANTFGRVIGDQSTSVVSRRQASKTISDDDSTDVESISITEEDVSMPAFSRDNGSPKTNGTFCNRSRLETNQRVTGRVRNVSHLDLECSTSSGKNSKIYESVDISSSDGDVESSMAGETSSKMSNKRRRLNTEQRSASCILIKDTDSEDTSSEAAAEEVFERNTKEISSSELVKETIEQTEDDGCSITKVIRDVSNCCPSCRKLRRVHHHKKRFPCPVAQWLRGDDLKEAVSSSTNQCHSAADIHSANPNCSSSSVKASCESEDGNVKNHPNIVDSQGAAPEVKTSTFSGGNSQSSASILTISDSDDDSENKSASVPKSCSSSDDYQNVDITITTKTVNTTVTSVKTKSHDDQKPSATTTSIKETVTSVNTTTLKTNLSSLVDHTGHKSWTTYKKSLKPGTNYEKKKYSSGGCLERSLQKYYYFRKRNRSTQTHECLI